MLPHGPSRTLNQVYYFCEEISFELENNALVTQWVLSTFKQEAKQVGVLNFIFCSDQYLYQLNMAYLNHDTLTDVITFPYTKEGEQIEGDIFISIDRVKDNAQTFQVPFNTELHRVMVHGCLHLMGFTDKTAKDQQLMRQKEDFYLAQLKDSA